VKCDGGVGTDVGTEAEFVAVVRTLAEADRRDELAWARVLRDTRFDLETQIGELGRRPFGDMVIERVDNADDPAPDGWARYLFALSHVVV
jgi:hypothetical protein